MIYPWQQSQWQHLEDDRLADRLSHGLLLMGQKGMGKFEFAQTFAKHLLMLHSPESHALLEAEHHPDYFLLRPLEGKKIIAVDQVREVQSQLQQTAHVSRYRVVIIEPADTMNIAASNALLKTLEEPPENVVLILVTSEPHRLLSTIRSRCRVINFYQAHDQETITWLQHQLEENQDAELFLNLAHGAPLAALNLIKGDLQTQRKIIFKQFSSLMRSEADPVAIANEWQKYEIWQILSWLQTWLLDISKIQLNVKLTIQNEKYQQVISYLAQHVDKNLVFNWLDSIGAFKRQLAQAAQQNLQLALEELLIEMYYGRKHHLE